MHHFSKGSSKNVSLSPTIAATATGGASIISPIKAVLSTVITNQNISKALSADSFSSVSINRFVISTASKPVAAVSSLANLVPNTGKEHFVA